MVNRVGVVVSAGGRRAFEVLLNASRGWSLHLAFGALVSLAVACQAPGSQPLEVSRSALFGDACSVGSCVGANQVCRNGYCDCVPRAYEDVATHSCVACDDSCATCLGPTVDDCTSCGTSTKLALSPGDSCSLDADCALLYLGTGAPAIGSCRLSACEVSGCFAGYYTDSGPTCKACTPITGCASGLTCNSSTGQRCAACAAGRYRSSGIGSTPDACNSCSGACPTGTYQTAACTATADRTCGACSAISGCATGLTCAGPTGQHCATCDANTYLVAGTNGAADSCTSCSGACAAGTHQATACTGTADRTCVACACPADACHPGTCNAAGVCDLAPNGTICDDHSLCTTADSCTSGSCGGVAVVCPTDACHPGTCQLATGTCAVSPDGTGCPADGNPCTADACSVGACVHPAGNAGATCGAASCSAGTATLAASCDGVATTCPSPATQICAPGLCSGAACSSDCVADTDCAAGAFCNGATCAAKRGAHASCAASSQCLSNYCIDGTCNVGARLVAVPSASPVPPRGAATFSVTGGSGAGLIFAVSTNASGGTIDAGGHYTAGQNDSVTDVVTVTDSFGNSAPSSIVIGPGVDLLPRAPKVSPRGALSFAAAGGSGLSFGYALRTNASGGTLDATTGAYLAGATPDVTDVITATDSLGNVAITNISVGHGVTVSPQSPMVAPHQQLALVASGGSGTGFTFILTTSASGGTVYATTGVYVAGGTAHTADLVTVTDSLGNTGTTGISVGGGVVVQPASLVTPPRGSATFVANGGGGAFVFTLVTNASGGSVDAVSGAYAAGPTGYTTDVLQVSDALGSSTMVNITVGPGLTLTPGAFSVAPLGGRALSVSGGAGSGYSFALTTNASGGSIDPSTGEYLAGPVGGVIDGIVATDHLGNQAVAAVTVTVVLAAGPSTLSVPPRGSATVTAVGGAPSYVFALTTSGSAGTIDPASGSYTAGGNSGTTDVVTIRDQNGATASVVITVGAGVSLAPTSPAAAPRKSIPFGATGGTGTGYVYQLTTNASGGAIDAATGVYTAGGKGNVADVVTATDSLGNTDAVTVSVGGNLVVNASASTVPPRGSLMLTAAGGSQLGYAYALTTNASGGTIQAATGDYLAGGTADVVDVVTVTDSLGNTASASIPVGHGLTVTPSVAATVPLGSFVLTVSGGSGNGYQFALTSNRSSGFIDGSGLYQAGLVGDVTDVATVTDSLGNRASVTITVGDGLTLTASAATVAPRGPATFTPAGGSGGGFTFVLRFNGSGGSINATTGAYIAGELPDSVDVVDVTDAFGNRASLAIAVGPGLTVIPAAPVVPPLGSFSFVASGGSGSGYRFTFATNASGGTLGVTTGLYVAGSTTDAVDVVRATDSLGNTLTIDVAVGGALTVNPSAPTVTPRGHVLLVAAGGSRTGYVFTLTTNASGGTVERASGAYAAGTSGNVVDIVTVTDDLGNTAHATIAVGDPLQISPLSIGLAPLGGVSFVTAGGSGAGYVFTLSSNGSSGRIDARTGAYLAGPAGDTTDVVTVTDSLGNSASGAVHVGSSLRLSGPAGTFAPRATLSLVVSGGAADVTFTVTTNASGGSINPATGVYTAGPKGNTTDVITARDGNGATAIVTVPIGPGVQIIPLPDGARAGTKVTLVATGGSETGYAWTLVSAGSGGVIQSATGVYTPGPHAGTDAIRVSDSLGNLADIEILVSVTPKRSGGGCAVAGSTAAFGFVPASLIFAVSVIRRRRRRS